MSPDDVITFFESLVDDQPDRATEDVLLDAAYSKRNDGRMWAFLLKMDSSITHGTGDTWQSAKTLPTDFDVPEKVYVGAADNEYLGVPYENILQSIGAANRYSIDYQGNSLRFLGPGDGSLTYLWYKYSPTSLIGLSVAQKAAATTIVWPKRFCPILAFDMAQIYLGGIDADDISRAQVPFHNTAHKELYNAMIAWDTKRRMKMFGNSSTPQRGYGRTTPADVVDIP